MYRIGIVSGHLYRSRRDRARGDDAGQVPSTPERPLARRSRRAGAAGRAARLERAAMLGQTDRIVHGTTVATTRFSTQGRANRPPDHRGPRDVIEMREGLRRALQPADAAARASWCRATCGSEGASGCAPMAASKPRSIPPRSTPRSAAEPSGSRRSRYATCTHGVIPPTSARPPRLRRRALPGLCLAVVRGSAQIKEFRAGLDDNHQRLCRPVLSRYSQRGGAARRIRLPRPDTLIQSHGGVAPIAEAGRLAAVRYGRGRPGGSRQRLSGPLAASRTCPVRHGCTSTDISLVVDGAATLVMNRGSAPTTSPSTRSTSQHRRRRRLDRAVDAGGILHVGRRAPARCRCGVLRPGAAPARP